MRDLILELDDLTAKSWEKGLFTCIFYGFEFQLEFKQFSVAS
jgi:hypothetical protein